MACHITVTGGELEQAEINAYIQRAKEKYGREPIGIDIKVDGDYVELSYDFGHQPFQRIRRITGYLVGTLERFNDGKRAEEHDRVKHTVLLYKRLESGSFQWPRKESEARALTPQQYRWLMEGLSIDQPKAHQPVKGLEIV